MTVDTETRNEPKATLQAMEVHSDWTRHFRTPENERFFGMAFDYIADCFGPPDGGIVLDAGCGSATKTIQLARRGYQVLGLDFSGAILEEARQATEAAGFADRTEFQQGDLTSLELSTDSVRHIALGRTLMHVPAVDKAVAELARILAHGGKLIVSEGNMRSIQAVKLRLLKQLLRRERAEVIRTPAGIWLLGRDGFRPAHDPSGRHPLAHRRIPTSRIAADSAPRRTVH